jgi:hypothetical protein
VQVCSEAADINLMIARKSNTKLPHEPWQNFLISDSRKRIETAFSQISSMLPKRIHAVINNNHDSQLLNDLNIILSQLAHHKYKQVLYLWNLM